MDSTLTSPNVAELLQRLFGEDNRQLPQLVERSRAYTRSGAPDQVPPADFKDMYLATDPEVGTLLYVLARACRASTVVEFGTSVGLSAIHLAAALRDNGGGIVITSEIEMEKVAAARENFAAAGLSDLIDVRTGDALDTLSTLPSDIDLVYLDGWPDLYLPVLRLVEPRLRKGALVAADYLPQESFIDPHSLDPFRHYIADQVNGYLVVDIPLGDTISLALRVH